MMKSSSQNLSGNYAKNQEGQDFPNSLSRSINISIDNIMLVQNEYVTKR